jgi:hypothetical protein
MQKAREKIMRVQEVKHSFNTCTTKWPNIKMELKNWLTDQRHKEFCVSKK